LEHPLQGLSVLFSAPAVCVKAIGSIDEVGLATGIYLLKEVKEGKKKL
jgi:hypothetical protein